MSSTQYYNSVTESRIAKQHSANRNALWLAQGIDHTSEPEWMQEARQAPLRSSSGRITCGVPAASARKAGHD